MINGFELAKAERDWAIQHRRHLHQYPELGNEEKSTSRYCQNILRELGYEISASYGYGFCADMQIRDANKTIAFRADMDALPIVEENKHSFISKHIGTAHMCGHDVHMAVALTVAKILATNKKYLKKNVRFIFQPCEEILPGGALGMIERGCLHNVDEIYALHVDSLVETGEVVARAGVMFAAVDIFGLLIIGRGSHAAHPSVGLDPIFAAAKLIMEWQGIVSRRIKPTNAAVISVTQINAGSADNIIPDTAKLGGTVRSLNHDDRALIEHLLRESVNALTAYDYQADFNYEHGYPPVVNDVHAVKCIEVAADSVVGRKNIHMHDEPSLGAEDFSYFLQEVPGAMFSLGCANRGRGISEPLHSPRFDADEDCIPIGVALMVNLAYGV